MVTDLQLVVPTRLTQAVENKLLRAHCHPRPDFGGRCASSKNFHTSPNNIINEINFKRQLYKLDKKV